MQFLTLFHFYTLKGRQVGKVKICSIGLKSQMSNTYLKCGPNEVTQLNSTVSGTSS